MEQRRLRLGDILDDYCPRERRVTNHAIVAMVEEDVKQTRCTTCDAEHVYKGGKAPRRKKSETTGKLYKQVLAGLTDKDPATAVDTELVDDPEHEQVEEPIEAVAEIIEESAPALEPAPEAEDDSDDSAQPEFDEGPVHRPLIRAQLPRVEGVKVERQAPDFTIRHAGGRSNGHFRGGGGGGNNGQRFGRGPHRGGGGGGGRGGGQGFGRGNQQRHGSGGGGGPRKRGR